MDKVTFYARKYFNQVQEKPCHTWLLLPSFFFFRAKLFFAETGSPKIDSFVTSGEPTHAIRTLSSNSILLFNIICPIIYFFLRVFLVCFFLVCWVVEGPSPKIIWPSCSSWNVKKSDHFVISNTGPPFFPSICWDNCSGKKHLKERYTCLVSAGAQAIACWVSRCRMRSASCSWRSATSCVKIAIFCKANYETESKTPRSLSKHSLLQSNR